MCVEDNVRSKAGAQSATTLALAEKESAEHMFGMEECRATIQAKPLTIKAHALHDPSAPASCTVVHFVRHGQGFHNLLADIHLEAGIEWTNHVKTPSNPYAKDELLDSPLTDKGRIQATMLQPELAALQQELGKPIELVVSSPNCRALATAVVAFDSLLNNPNVPWLAHEMAREENGVHLCDKRRPTSHQAREFPMFDFSLLETEEDTIFLPDRRETKTEVGERIYKFMNWLSTRPETHVGIASHSAWLMTVFNGVVECSDPSLQKWFHTGEMRSVKLSFESNFGES
jgi:broad specificity phosphatase PhoE